MCPISPRDGSILLFGGSLLTDPRNDSPSIDV